MPKATNILAVLVLVLVLAPSDIFCAQRLVFSQVLFRHGDRNPYTTYPNDPWKDKKHWPEGFGQLTKVGMQQLFQLGEYIRKRYESILPQNVYPSKLVYVHSTDIERTLMSAASLLAGLFPPTRDQIWNKRIMWQPVPIHTMPAEVDSILCPTAGKQCARYDFLKKQHYNRPENKAWRTKYDWLFQLIKNKTGSASDNPWPIHDTLKIQLLKNKTIPDWATPVYDEIETIATFEGFNSAGSREMSRLTAGYLLRDIIQRFHARIGGSLKKGRNLWLYAVHDVNISRFMTLLNIRDSKHPPYAASLFLELYKDNGQYFVQIVYKKDNEPLPPLEIPGCGRLCPLDKFHEIYKPFIPMNDIETECKMN